MTKAVSLAKEVDTSKKDEVTTANARKSSHSFERLSMVAMSRFATSC